MTSRIDYHDDRFHDDDAFGRRRHGITRYVVVALVASLAVGVFLYADGYFDQAIEEVGEVAGQVVNPG